jgi:hypothetical protein
MRRFLPRRLDDNLLIETWNLRVFGKVTEKWRFERGILRERPRSCSSVNVAL